MNTKLVLITLALAQFAWAKPAAEKDVCLLKAKYDILASAEKDNRLPASTQLLEFSSMGLAKLTKKYANGGKIVSEQLLKSEEILNSKSAKVLEFKQNLTKFEENYAKCDGLDALFELAGSYSDTTSFYFENDAATFDDDAKFILSLLRKYNSEELDREFEKYFDVFVADFDKKFDGLKEDLAKEEGKLSKKLPEWLAHFKTLKSYDDKIVAFEQYFELYE